MQDFLVEARKAHFQWGPRKLRAWLLDRYPGREFSGASCIWWLRLGIVERIEPGKPQQNRPPSVITLAYVVMAASFGIAEKSSSTVRSTCRASIRDEILPPAHVLREGVAESAFA